VRVVCKQHCSLCCVDRTGWWILAMGHRLESVMDVEFKVVTKN
jgi:hypothetical protein